MYERTGQMKRKRENNSKKYFLTEKPQNCIFVYYLEDVCVMASEELGELQTANVLSTVNTVSLPS